MPTSTTERDVEGPGRGERLVCLDAARAVVSRERYADVEVHCWQFGGCR